MKCAVQLRSKLNEKHDGSIFQSCKFLMRNVENLVTVCSGVVTGQHSKLECCTNLKSGFLIFFDWTILIRKCWQWKKNVFMVWRELHLPIQREWNFFVNYLNIKARNSLSKWNFSRIHRLSTNCYLIEVFLNHNHMLLLTDRQCSLCSFKRCQSWDHVREEDKNNLQQF